LLATLGFPLLFNAFRLSSHITQIIEAEKSRGDIFDGRRKAIR
jgi:hypothetical protein